MVMLFIASTYYGILIWLPMYLQEKNFKNFEGFISISFSFFNFLGAAFLGILYEKFP